MYILTKSGRKAAETYIRELEAKRKEILDAGSDTADETTLPTVEDIEADIDFIGLDANDGDPSYYNSWGVTDSYDADKPICLEYGVDFVDGGFVPEDDEEVRIADQFTNGRYTDMLPGMVVMDYALSSYWKVLSNDGTVVRMQNMKGGENGVLMNVSNATDHNTFVVFAEAA